MNKLEENEILLEQFYINLNTIQSIPLLGDPLFSSDQKSSLELETIIKTERKVFSCYINNGQGNLSSELSEILFSNEEIKYIKQRLEDCKNMLIKSRYAHVLWNFNKKHNDYAKIAINSYLEIIDEMIIKKQNFTSFLEGAIYLLEHSQTDIDRELIKKRVRDIIKSEDIIPSYKYVVSSFILNSKLFKSAEIEFILDIAKNWITPTYTSLNDFILDLLIEIAKKNQKSTDEYYELLAENKMLLLIQQHNDPKNFLHTVLLGEIAEYYKKAGNNEKYEEIMTRYSIAKNKIESTLISNSTTISKQLYDDFINGNIKLILNSEEMLNVLSIENHLIEVPNQVFEKSVYDYFTIITFDSNGNYTTLSNEEKKMKKMNDFYHIYMDLYQLPIISGVMHQGLMDGKFNYVLVFDYFKNGWFGQVINEDGVTWLDYLNPGLIDFFLKFESNASSYILFVDSFIPKIEGILRHFIHLKGGKTTIMKRIKGKGDAYFPKEVLLEELLENQKIIEFFSNEDIELFKYVLINSNLRNNISHSFTSRAKYTMKTAILIFLCILRLSKFQSVKDTKS